MQFIGNENTTILSPHGIKSIDVECVHAGKYRLWHGSVWAQDQHLHLPPNIGVGTVPAHCHAIRKNISHFEGNYISLAYHVVIPLRQVWRTLAGEVKHMPTIRATIANHTRDNCQLYARQLPTIRATIANHTRDNCQPYVRHMFHSYR